MAYDDKARLYRRLVTGTSDATVLARMRLHGFWPLGRGLPADPPDELKKRLDLEQKLVILRDAEVVATQSPEKLLEAERKRRWAALKQRRAEKKAARAKAVQARRDAFAKLRRSSVLHAGLGVSKLLNDTKSDHAALRARGLPVLDAGPDLAMMLGIPLGVLRWLTFHRRGATLVHYHRFSLPKKAGGQRAISAPKPRLKTAQAWVGQNVLGPLALSPHAHGFVPGRSTVTNAALHVGKKVVVNLDVRDFFPTFGFRRVRGLFRHLGYSGQVATLLALLCTEPPRLEASVDGTRVWVALGHRVLPQGASTSPALTNLLCHRLDQRLAGLARRHGFAFSRYADDLTFSGDHPERLGKLLKSARAILAAEGLVEHPDKTKVMRASQQQEVTGIVVNTQLGLPRDTMRRLRATLHNCARHGLDSQNREGHPNFRGYLEGMVAYASMVNPEKAAPLRAALALALGG